VKQHTVQRRIDSFVATKPMFVRILSMGDFGTFTQSKMVNNSEIAWNDLCFFIPGDSQVQLA
jgi:hypothetical protein